METNSQTNNKRVIPPPVHNQFLIPVEFWVKVLSHLDAKTDLVMKTSGYGEVALTITIADHQIRDVIFGDEIRVRGLIQLAQQKKLASELDKEK